MGIIAAILSAITLFLPYAVYYDGSWSSLYKHDDWIFNIILAVIALFLSVKKIKTGTINTVGLFAKGVKRKKRRKIPATGSIQKQALLLK